MDDAPSLYLHSHTPNIKAGGVGRNKSVARVQKYSLGTQRPPRDLVSSSITHAEAASSGRSGDMMAHAIDGNHNKSGHPTSSRPKMRGRARQGRLNSRVTVPHARPPMTPCRQRVQQVATHSPLVQLPATGSK